MRSLLFVPGDSERKLEKALSSGADVLILDLEDSVSLARKEAARRITAEFIKAHQAPEASAPLLYIRINPLGSLVADADLAAIMPQKPHGIMLPKPVSGRDVTHLSVKLRVAEAENGIDDYATRIIPIITETAGAVLSAASYADTTSRLAGLTWGAEDLAADLGAQETRGADGHYGGPFALARSLTLLAAASAGVPAIDTVYPAIRDAIGFRRECEQAAAQGFTAKMAVHPAQIPVIHEAFMPSEDAIEEARAIVAAFAHSPETGVASLHGRMIDQPHLRRARQILERARQYS